LTRGSSFAHKPQGIALPIDQFSALITALPNIEAALSSHGLEVPRPDYSESGDDDEEMEEEADNAHKASRSLKVEQELRDMGKSIEKAAKKESKNTKKNFEETSEEEE